MLVQTDEALRNELAPLVVTVTGIWDLAIMKLYSNDFVPTAAMDLADLTEADFNGYAASAGIVWGSPITNTDGSAEASGPSNQFESTDGVIQNTIYGYYLVDPTELILFWAERFAQPIEIIAAGQGVVLVPRYVLGRTI